MTAGDVLSDDVVLPGDVVLDMSTHRPMQVTGYEQRRAENVADVWNSDVNQEHYEINPDEPVIELVDIPTGTHYFVPEHVQRYPEIRLGRLLPEPATNERRPQQKVVRAVLSHLLADVRERQGDSFAATLLSVFRDHWTDQYVHEIEEFSETLPSQVEG